MGCVIYSFSHLFPNVFCLILDREGMYSCPCYLLCLNVVLQTRYNAARMAIADRGSRVSAVIESLEREMELLCVTGVEDKLQDKVRPTLELLRNAGIKV